MRQLIQAQLALAVLFGVGCMQAHAQASDAPISAVQDWSSRTVIFGKPMFPDEFAKVSEMEKRYRDPRYVTAVMHRLDAELPANPVSLRRADKPAPGSSMGMSSSDPNCKNDRRWRGHCDDVPAPEVKGSVTRDWSNVLGNGDAGNGPRGMYPAKYNFDIFAGPSCVNDFVVYGTNAASASQGVGTSESRTTTVTDAPGGTITIGTAPRAVTLTPSATPVGNLQFSNAGTNTQRAAALAAAVNIWTQQTGVSATSNLAVVTYNRIGTGDTDPIAITDTLTNTTLAAAVAGTGTSGQPSILAFNQLYNTTCNGTRSNTNAPNTMWAYNTSTAAATNAIVETSPVLSYYDNGKQVAYIQRSGNVLQLVLLKWQSGQGTVGAPVTPTLSASAAAYRACVSGCYYAMTLSGTTNTGNGPTFSSPYVDYTNDLIWVGDGNSQLHKFTGVFQGNPAEVTSGGFPATVATAGLDLSPAVDDGTYVYIGSESGATDADGGRIHRVTASNGTVVSSAKLYADSRNGFRAPMILDTSVNRLNAFSFSHPGTITDASLCRHQGTLYVYCRAVVQFDTANFTAGTSGTKREIGLGSITGENVVLWMGAFDDAYYSSGTGTGAMYMCGGSLPRTQQTYLWKVPYTNGVMGLPLIGPQIGADDADTDGTIYNCSPPTVIKNGSNEYLFVSVSGAGPVFASAPGCGAATDTDPLSACMYMFNLNDLAQHETWTMAFANDQAAGTFTVNGILFTGNNLATACTAAGGNFNMGGNTASDAAELRLCLTGNVPGFTVSGTGTSVVVTTNSAGNVSNTLVSEAIGGGGNTITRVNGSAATTTWASTNQPRAALQVIGGTGGIIVDNVQNGTTGAQQIYTTQAGTLGNAVQASQSGLQ